MKCINMSSMLSSSTLPHGLLQGFSLEAISLYPLALCTIIYWIFLVESVQFLILCPTYSLLLCFEVWLFTCKAPSYLCEFLKTLPVKPAHKSFFAVPRLRLKQIGDGAFGLAAPRLPNNISLPWRKTHINIFKKLHVLFCCTCRCVYESQQLRF